MGSLDASGCAFADDKLTIPNMMHAVVKHRYLKPCADIRRIFMINAFQGPIILFNAETGTRIRHPYLRIL